MKIQKQVDCHCKTVICVIENYLERYLSIHCFAYQCVNFWLQFSWTVADVMAGANSELASEGSFVKLLFDPLPCNTGQTRAHEENVRIVELCTTCDFLAMLVALHSTHCLYWSVTGGSEFRTNGASKACELVFLPKENMIMMKIATAMSTTFVFQSASCWGVNLGGIQKTKCAIVFWTNLPNNRPTNHPLTRFVKRTNYCTFCFLNTSLLR